MNQYCAELYFDQNRKRRRKKKAHKVNFVQYLSKADMYLLDDSYFK